MLLRERNPGAGEMVAQQLRARTAFQRNGLQITAASSGSLQPPVIPAPRDLMPSSESPCINTSYMHTGTIILIT